jgi:NagD protein
MKRNAVNCGLIKNAQRFFNKKNYMKYGLLIDMDGVIYSGETLIEGADKFIGYLLKQKIPFTFMTNNSQRTRLESVRKLKGFGIEVTEDHV